MNRSTRKQSSTRPNGFDLDAERALIGAMMLSPDIIDIAEDLSPLHFSEPNRAIFESIAEVRRTGDPVTIVTVNAQLRDCGRLEAVGGPSYLAGLSSDAIGGSTAAAAHYADVLREKFTHRRVLEIAKRLHESLENGADLGAFEEAFLIVAQLRARSITAPLTALMDISTGEPDPRATVLGNRFLCIGGAMLFVGPSGIGKSSASVQQDILWSLGREAFGIRPARPLRILTVQAENDGEDLAEMRDGVCRGLRLSDEDRARVRENVFYETEAGRTGPEFLAYVESRLRLAKFDLLRIDPFQAYLGEDPKETKATAEFLRVRLNPALTRHGCAGIVNHHTPKTNHRDTTDWRGSDWMYAGAGGADITNWARAVLVIDPTHAPHVFKFIAAKRSGRIGWVNEDGEKEFSRYYCHASDGLYWRAAESEDLAAVETATNAKKTGKTIKTGADMKALVPMEGAIAKNVLLENARSRGFTRDSARAILAELLEAGELFVWWVKRHKTNPEVRISRHEQTLMEAGE